MAKLQWTAVVAEHAVLRGCRWRVQLGHRHHQRRRISVRVTKLTGKVLGHKAYGYPFTALNLRYTITADTPAEVSAPASTPRPAAARDSVGVELTSLGALVLGEGGRTTETGAPRVADSL